MCYAFFARSVLEPRVQTVLDEPPEIADLAREVDRSLLHWLLALDPFERLRFSQRSPSCCRTPTSCAMTASRFVLFRLSRKPLRYNGVDASHACQRAKRSPRPISADGAANVGCSSSRRSSRFTRALAATPVARPQRSAPLDTAEPAPRTNSGSRRTRAAHSLRRRGRCGRRTRRRSDAEPCCTRPPLRCFGTSGLVSSTCATVSRSSRQARTKQGARGSTARPRRPDDAPSVERHDCARALPIVIEPLY